MTLHDTAGTLERMEELTNANNPTRLDIQARKYLAPCGNRLAHADPALSNDRCDQWAHGECASHPLMGLPAVAPAAGDKGGSYDRISSEMNDLPNNATDGPRLPDVGSPARNSGGEG